ncbi:DUF1579 domain-containing protein [Psychroserpens sp.]|uniref:DUF1579 domain-containing protein n=1 Tax=Psychroserpens sp. TaxID=2020870 RepID=UPI001B176356|nr:DUF1579 domain-containing protein [Psychroserpens sp.]MBO6607344.1 DUF1579 domain-containing protein [Psychroserpens sp.]MBO6630800.1 DUF1579 domain-containing protein [Psychroserpens sp.]MBO6654580.1 DUF1579 domain-containing protein [Psychroserpens sp.]MBO6681073.1 DUF1579 domain-containing protein [Psychroserpens sp.]MBO6749972.1 DUF1579 domain-containing protein [Psychroserpens sp.]
MKKLVLALILMSFCSINYAQTPEEMKAWEDSMTPGKYHKWLASFDGEWQGDVKMWMDPTQPPMASTMKTTNRMIMNGLYQKSTHSGEMMGKPFKGEGTVGYDNIKKRFITTWIDNFGSGIMQMEGELSSDDKVMVTIGKMSDPMSGQDMTVKQVLTYISDDRHLFEMYMVLGDKEMKTMEINYSRMK